MVVHGEGIVQTRGEEPTLPRSDPIAEGDGIHKPGVPRSLRFLQGAGACSA